MERMRKGKVKFVFTQVFYRKWCNKIFPLKAHSAHYAPPNIRNRKWWKLQSAGINAAACVFSNTSDRKLEINKFSVQSTSAHSRFSPSNILILFLTCLKTLAMGFSTSNSHIRQNKNCKDSNKRIIKTRNSKSNILFQLIVYNNSLRVKKVP